MSRLLPLILFSFLAAVASGGEPSPADAKRLTDEISRLVADLDSSRFEIRDHAADRLEELVAQPAAKGLLAAEFQRRLARTDLSFEVRRRLVRWARRLPAAPPGDASPDELDKLVQQIDDDSYSVRLGAIQRIESLIDNPKMVCPVMTRLKRRLAKGPLGTEVRRQLESIWQRARKAWLLGAGDCNLPAVTQAEIDEWLDALVESAATKAPSAATRRWAAAERELVDLLARDEYVSRVKTAIEARLAAQPSDDAAARLKAVLDWTKPELIAEYWSDAPGYGTRGCRQRGEQHLIVGVPTLSPGAAHPTHFDRADDRVAHYVSGNSLTPGDYPVGEAFPHPQGASGFFHLVNLPTPRRRMAYLYSTKGTDAKRLTALSRRTLDHVLADKRALSEPELVMLGQLDPAEVSRFAGRYFLAVDDVPLSAVGVLRLGGRPSRFGMIAACLATDGTKDAIPGLTDAIRQERFLPLTVRAPYRLDWIAALSIASRDPWSAVDAWLAEQIGQVEPLMAPVRSPFVSPTMARPWGEPEDPFQDDDAGRPAAGSRRLVADVGATAAALLLKRQGQLPSQFGLHLAPDALLRQLHVEGYRFADDASRRKVQQWWETRQKARHERAAEPVRK